MSGQVRVLYVDDYPMDRALVRDALTRENHGFELVEAASRREFESLLGQGTYDIVLSDFNILGFAGLQVIAAVHQASPDLPVIIVTGTGSEEIAAQALKQGASDYVIKSPRHIQHLPFTIQNVLEAKRLQADRERQRAELQDAYHFVTSIVDTSPAALVVLNAQARIAIWNEAAERIFGWERSEIGGREIPFVPDEHRAEFADLLRKAMQGEQFLNQQSSARRKDGRPIDVLFSAIPLLRKGDASAGVLMAVTDISECKQAERQLAASEHRLRELTQHLNDVSEREKANLSRELHDHLGQHLTAMKLGLQQAGAELVSRGTEWTQRMEALVNVADEAIEMVRETCMDLRPASLDRFGLAAALKDEVERIQEIGRIRIDLDYAVPSDAIDKDLASNLFRIVQESLTNVLRHANATEAKVTLRRRNDYLELTVCDNGVGIQKDNLADKRSLGLVGMQERVRAYDGMFDIHPGPEGGTQVRIRIPLADPTEA
jgi:two-component system, NarL family, sensor histidine kinase UhpB